MIDQAKNTQPLDLAYLKDMAGDSPEFLIEMLDTFVEQIPTYMDDLEKAILAKDWKATSEFAHKLKPTFYYVGREDVRDFVQEIEKNAREQVNLENIESSFNQIKAFMPIIYRQIEASKAQILG